LGYLALALTSNTAAFGCDPTSTTHDSKAQSVSQTIVIVAPDETSGEVSARPEPEPEPLQDPYCAHGFRGSGVARTDVLRLSALCAGSNGMQASESIELVGDPPGGSTRRIELGAGDCVWAVAASEPKGAPLRVRWSEGERLIADCDLSGAGWCPERQPLCATRASRFEVAVDLPDAEFAFAAVWRR
jgi:hypothetical protein